MGATSSLLGDNKNTIYYIVIFYAVMLFMSGFDTPKPAEAIKQSRGNKQLQNRKEYLIREINLLQDELQALDLEEQSQVVSPQQMREWIRTEIHDQVASRFPRRDARGRASSSANENSA